MLDAILLTLRQLGDRAFLWPLLGGLAGALAVFAGLAGLSAWALGGLAGGTGWLAGLAATAGGLLTLGLAVWLFVPVMLAISGLFVDVVAAAVERRFYPGLPPAAGAGLLAQGGFNLWLGVKAGAASLIALPLALLFPPLGAMAFLVIGAVSLGHGLFEGVAQRRMGVAEARAARRQREGQVLGLGFLLALLSLVPGLNLLVPVVGTAAMTHLLHRAG
jgi:uncharacterized protein involved in cysteine biosynthesis